MRTKRGCRRGCRGEGVTITVILGVIIDVRGDITIDVCGGNTRWNGIVAL